MNLQMTKYSTFRKHARNLIEPTVIHKWNRDQLHLITQLQQQGKVPLAGDMHADTLGMLTTLIIFRQWLFALCK